MSRALQPSGVNRPRKIDLVRLISGQAEFELRELANRLLFAPP
jgi:hypothetical protein